MTADMLHFNRIDKNFIDYIEAMPDKENLLNSIRYAYGAQFHVLRKRGEGDYVRVSTPDNSILNGTGTAMNLTGTDSIFTEVIDNKDYVLSEYDLIDGYYPTQFNELALVVDSYNRVNINVLNALGINYLGDDDEPMQSIPFEELLGMEFRLIGNDAWYGTEPKTAFDALSLKNVEYFAAPSSDSYEKIYDDERNVTLKITGILRQNENTAFALYNAGLLHLKSLTDYYLNDCKTSAFGKLQAANEERLMLYMRMSYNGTTVNAYGVSYDMLVRVFNEQFVTTNGGDPSAPTQVLTVPDAKMFAEQIAGVSDIPSAIYFYPKGFAEKSAVARYLDDYNKGFDNKLDKIIYIDAVAIVGSTMEQMVNIIQYVLIAFAAVSLIVSSIMIGIITYVSVIERTKEIGVLRSLGARKKDISRVFNAETLIIGFVAGVIGVVISYILCIPINYIILGLADGAITVNIAVLNPLHALLMICVSMVLTLISGLIPSSVAAKKDPVVALRTE